MPQQKPSKNPLARLLQRFSSGGHREHKDGKKQHTTLENGLQPRSQIQQVSQHEPHHHRRRRQHVHIHHHHHEHRHHRSEAQSNTHSSSRQAHEHETKIHHDTGRRSSSPDLDAIKYPLLESGKTSSSGGAGSKTRASSTGKIPDFMRREGHADEGQHRMRRPKVPALSPWLGLDQNLAVQFAMAQQPETEYVRAYAHKGAPYPITEQELMILQYPGLRPNMPGWRPLPPPIPLYFACQQLLQYLNRTPGPSQTMAAARIKSARSSRLSWDLLVKMFNDLDVLIFGGELYHRVCLRWVDMRLTQAGAPELGYTLPPRNFFTRRIEIYMSSDTDWRTFPSYYALGALLHEMLHAVFLVKSRDVLEMPVMPHHDVTHGPLYEVAAKRIERYVGMDLTSDPTEMLVPRKVKGQIWHPRYCANSSMNNLGTRSTYGKSG